MLTMSIRKQIIFLLVLTSVNATAQTREDSVSLKVGYSTGDTRTMAGAVEKVTQERMNKGLVNSSLDALSGQAAGVQVSQTSPRFLPSILPTSRVLPF